MIELLLIIIGSILFITSGLGYITLNYFLLGVLELCAFLFNGFFGLVIVGFAISFFIASFHKHS